MIKYLLHSHDVSLTPLHSCAWPESRVSLILRDPEINACKETANDKNTLGTEKGLLLAVSSLRTGLNSKDGEILHYVIYDMAASFAEAVQKFNDRLHLTCL
ncbi:hypothetical protein F2P79_009050 [Pimephales promelas]|nr:hypothetical protein F2P79_009050 [Pimephales promelas]